MPITLDQAWDASNLNWNLPVQGLPVPLGIFNADEQALFNTGYDDYFFNRDGAVRLLYTRRKPELILAARAAKTQLKNKTFGGFSAANTAVGFSPIRPGHAGFTSNATAKPNNVWRFGFAAGNNQWIGAGTASPVTIGQNMVLANIGIMELAPKPVADVVKMDIGRANILPLDAHQLRLPDIPGVFGLHVCPLPVTFWGTSETVSVQINSDNGGVSELVPMGLTFAPGATLNNLTYNESQRTS